MEFVLLGLSWLCSMISFVAVIWIVVVAVQEEDYIWAVASFFCFIATLIYAVKGMPRTTIPLIMLAASFVFSLIFSVAAVVIADPVEDPGEFEIDFNEDVEMPDPFGLHLPSKTNDVQLVWA